ncbi:MAG: 3'-5' exonuclease domain-containing protein 2 [Paludibacter sp.]|nr:3'-5' exonuclease domain-containing protein 2 [Paludibacter sp.]
MFKTKITKDEVNQMPVVVFEGKITLVDDISKIKPAIEELRKSQIVGIDTETKPSFTRGTHHKVSLVQISTLDHCFLFRLNKIDFPSVLAEFLGDENVKKIGLSLRDDFSGLNKHHAFKPANSVDIQTIIQSYGILELSLQKIYAILFGKKISKSQRLTNWENPELSEQQQRYAATDAWASLQIYLRLMQEEKLPKKQLDKILMENALEQRELREQQDAKKQAESLANNSELTI